MITPAHNRCKFREKKKLRKIEPWRTSTTRSTYYSQLRHIYTLYNQLTSPPLPFPPPSRSLPAPNQRNRSEIPPLFICRFRSCRFLSTRGSNTFPRLCRSIWRRDAGVAMIGSFILKGREGKGREWGDLKAERRIEVERDRGREGKKGG